MRALFLVFLMGPCGPLWAGSFNSTSKATTVSNFLQLGVGARAVSMGEAYVAVVDEASALYWNPGALTRVDRRALTAMHARSFDSSHFGSAAYAQKIGDSAAFGVGFQYFSAGTVVETDDATGQDVGTFNPSDLAVSLGYARDLAGYSVGVAGKFIRSRLLASDQTGAMDAGVLSPKFMSGKLRLGAAMANLGGRLKFERTPERLPLTFRAGGAYKIFDYWLVSLDAIFPNNNDAYAAVGTEYTYPMGDAGTVAARMGFNSQTIGEVTGFTGFTVGVGAAYESTSVDYAFSPLGKFGNVHRMSISIHWDGESD